MAPSPRLFAALLFAPLAGSVLGALTSAFIATMGTPSGAVFKFQFAQWFPWIIGVTFTTSMTLGIGFHIIACRLNWRRFATYWIAGGLIAGSVVLSAALLTMGTASVVSDALADCVEYLAVALPTGISTAGLAWLIRRPDRDPPNPTTPAP